MKIGVRILPRREVLDTQGRAVEKTLKDNGHQLSQCRVGKYIQLDIPTDNVEKAMQEARQMAEFVLYNPLIENFELEVIE